MSYQTYTIRPLLWVHKKAKDGRSPLMIAVTISRKITYFKTPYRLLESEWDSDVKELINYPHKSIVNAALKKQMSDIEKEISVRQLDGEHVSAQSIKRENSTKVFATFAKEIREEPVSLKRIADFGGEGLLLKDITPEFLRKFEKHERTRKNKARKTDHLSPNSINKTFKYLRRIIKQAKREKLIKEDPFNEFQVPRYINPDRVYLVEDEKQKLFELLEKDLPIAMRITLSYFLFACYSGLRFADWARFNPEKMVENDFLKLRAKKNKELVILPIGPTLKKIIEKISILPAPLSLEQTNVMLKAIGVMAGIDKTLSTHVGRHSFATMCASNGLPQSVTAELMGVSEKVVSVYYHLTGESIILQAAVMRTI